jgi:hypothetical protein
MLHVNPKMLPRLTELEDDLLQRRQQAVTAGWLGEVEGIDLTVRFLREKRQQAERLRKLATEVNLGMPLTRRS